MSKELVVGQVVRILDGRDTHSDCMVWVDDMDTYIGKVATITFVAIGNFVDLEGSPFGWDYAWLEVIE